MSEQEEAVKPMEAVVEEEESSKKRERDEEEAAAPVEAASPNKAPAPSIFKEDAPKDEPNDLKPSDGEKEESNDQNDGEEDHEEEEDAAKPEAKEDDDDEEAGKENDEPKATLPLRPIKRARTAYFIFADDKREEIKALVSIGALPLSSCSHSFLCCNHIVVTIFLTPSLLNATNLTASG